MAASVSNVSSNKSVMCEPYMSYDSLPEGYIRLLKIYGNPDPWNFEEEIEIQLVSVPLAKCPPYVTLSYTWGEPDLVEDPTAAISTKVPRCFPIKCGGRFILGTRNLRNALRRLRLIEDSQNAPAKSDLGKIGTDFREYNKGSHLYWIDAICINQEDSQERSTQVSLMGKIYGQAQCTIVWLGERDAYTVSAVQVLLKIVGGKISHDNTISFSDSTTTEPNFKGIDTLSDAEITALGMLMAKTWISRTWILQEAILSPSVVTLWGGLFFPLDVLLRAGANLSSSRSSLRFSSRFSEIAAKSTREVGHGSAWKRVLVAQSTLVLISSSRLDLRHNQKPSFTKVVAMCRDTVSTDPRDKIYGILGLAAEFELNGEANLIPDYSQTVAKVYMTATAFVIRSRADLACLTLVCDHSLKKIEGLPSWCPDYSASIAPLANFDDIARKWRLALAWPNALAPEILGTSVLRVNGSLFDVVAETATLLYDLRNPMKHGLSAVLNLAVQLGDQDAFASTTRQHHGPFEVLWRTLILDQFDNDAPAPATAVDFIPSFIMFLLCIVLRMSQAQPSKLGSRSFTKTPLTEKSVLAELQRLETSVNQLKCDTRHASTGLPNVDSMRKWIERSSLQSSSDANNVQSIIEGLVKASEEELDLCHRARAHGGPTVDPLGRDPSSSDFDQTFELLKRHFVGNIGDGRLTRVYFRTGSTLGAGQPSVRAGDEIWFLYGAFAPVILRPLGNGHYRFMGEAYVHGVMYGEAGGESRRHEVIVIE